MCILLNSRLCALTNLAFPLTSFSFMFSLVAHAVPGSWAMCTCRSIACGMPLPHCLLKCSPPCSQITWTWLSTAIFLSPHSLVVLKGEDCVIYPFVHSMKMYEDCHYVQGMVGASEHELVKKKPHCSSSGVLIWWGKQIEIWLGSTGVGRGGQISWPSKYLQGNENTLI